MTIIYTLNSKVLKNIVNDKWLIKKPDPYNPLGLPPNTVRVRTNDGNPPIKLSYGAKYDSATLVAGTSDVYDVYKSGTSFDNLLSYSSNIIEVLGANTTGITNMNMMFYNDYNITSIPLFDTSSVTNMNYMLTYCRFTTVPLFDTSKVTTMNRMFNNCSSLLTVPLFDTSKVTNMSYMFYYCTSLTTVPLLDTSRLANMDYMFSECTKVQSGALALYQQVSTQASPPSSHTQTFHSCGSNTTTGAAELAQIPSDWK